ncbi:MAG: hypothetical protein MJZ64_08450 [Paludibacteraceae bacterium]|nr:hypothetical protein [Paludibacteraceae bacterium]
MDIDSQSQEFPRAKRITSVASVPHHFMGHIFDLYTPYLSVKKQIAPTLYEVLKQFVDSERIIFLCGR